MFKSLYHYWRMPLTPSAMLRGSVLGAVLFSVLSLGLGFGVAAQAAKPVPQVRIADPFIELHTGAGRGYPIFYVEERGQWIEILRRRTEWFEVRTRRNKIGWVHRSQLERTLSADGEAVAFADVQYGDFIERRWEVGTLGGEFGGTSMMSIYTGYRFTKNLSTEVAISQVLGRFSDISLLDVNVVHQPFPEWKLSPFFTIGTGIINTQPAATIVQSDDRSDQTLNVGAGVWWYFTRSFVLRAEYHEHIVLTNRNTNEEVNQWKAGISVFF